MCETFDQDCILMENKDIVICQARGWSSGGARPVAGKEKAYNSRITHIFTRVWLGCARG